MSEAGQSIKREMILGSAWMVGMRWVIRGIGLISTMILARILVPEDFGLVAMAMVIVNLMDVITSFGVDMAIIQNSDAKSRDYFDTGWTLKIIQTCAAGLLLALSAPFAAEYYQEARVADILYLLSLAVALSGFENIGVVAFRKELEFHKEFRYQVIKKIGSFFVTIGCAIVLQSYWALIIGMFFGRVLEVALSYLLHSFRPRFSMSRIKELWSFSQWMLVANIGAHIKSEVIDLMIVGRYHDAAALGVYREATEISALPTKEVIWPLSRALFPGYSRLKEDKPRLRAAYKNVVSVMVLFLIPCAAGITLLADNVVYFILGNQWGDAIEPLKWLAVYGSAFAISGNAFNVLAAVGKLPRMAMFVWLEIIVTIPILLWAAQAGTIADIAMWRAFIGLAIIPLYFSAIVHVEVLRWRDVFDIVWRPILATIVMWFALTELRDFAPLYQGVADLSSQLFAWISFGYLQTTGESFYHLTAVITKATIGGLVFVVSMFALWLASGRPAFGEALIFDKLLSRLNK